MAFIRTKESNLLQGVSQQPDVLRVPGQLAAMDNAFPSPVEGNRKRHYTKHLARISANKFVDAKLHAIDRDVNDRYVLTLTNETIDARDVFGNQIPVVSLVSNNLTKESEFDDDTTVPSPWQRSLGIEVEADVMIDPDGGSEADLVRSTDGATNRLIFQTLAGFGPANDGKKFMYRVRAKIQDAESGQADFRMQADYEDGGLTHNLTVDLTDGTVSASSNLDGSLVEDLGEGWYLISMIFTIDDATGNPGAGTDMTFDLFPTTGSPVVPGGVGLYKAQLFDLSSVDLTYLDIREPNPVSTPETFSSWTIQGDAAAAAATALVGPFGFGTWARLSNKAGSAGSNAQWVTNPGRIFDGPQVFSCYFKFDSSPPAGIGTTEVRLFIQDNTTPSLSHGARFVFTGTVLSFDSFLTGTPRFAGVEDLGNDAYRAWVVIDPDDDVSTVAGNVRRLRIDVQDVGGVGTEQSILAWGALVDNSRESPGPYIDPNKSIRATTINDFTFVSNARKTVALSPTLTPIASEPEKGEAFVFIRQASFDTRYEVQMEHGDPAGTIREDAASVNVTSTDTTTDQAFNTWEYVITSVANGNTFTITFFTGSATPETVSYTALATDTIKSVRTILVRKIRALFSIVDYGATGTGLDPLNAARLHGVNADDYRDKGTILIESRERGFDLDMSEGGTGGATITEIYQATDVAVRVVRTEAIAQALAGLIQGWTNVETDVVGSVIRITTTGTDQILNLQAHDSMGDTGIVRVFKQVEFFDDLPLICRNGYKIKVIGNVEENIDDYWVRFVGDSSEGFTHGGWEETAAEDISFKFDDSTMPHTLARRQDDTNGAITGVANQIYFEWSPGPWKSRGAGDEKTAPPPSFVGEQIRDTFLWQTRLGFLAGQNVVFSEAGRFFNFWRTTVTQLPDDETIDISVGHSKVSLLNSVVAIEEELFAFSDRTQFIIGGTPALTPRTASIAPKLEWENLRRVKPISTGSTILFAFKDGEFSGIREIIRQGEEEFDTTEITSHVSKYLPGEIKSQEISTDAKVAVFVCSGDASRLYLHKYIWDGRQKLQSAWFRYSFGANTRALGAVFIQDELFVALERDDGVFLESMVIADGLTDPGSTFQVLLDRRLTSALPAVSASYAAGTDQTTFTLPYVMDAGESYQVVTRGAAAGQILGETNGRRNQCQRTEDLAATGFWSQLNSPSVTRNATTAPDGTTTADDVLDGRGAANSSLFHDFTGLVNGQNYIWSMHVKQNTAAKCQLLIFHNGGTKGISLDYEFATKAKTTNVTGGAATAFGVAELPNGWFRLWVRITHDTADSTTLRCSFLPDTESTASTNATYAWGASFEAVNRLSEYEPVRGDDGGGTSSLVIPGNHASTDVWIGQQYVQSIQPTNAIVREQSQGGIGYSDEPRLQMKDALLRIIDTGEFRVLVTPEGRDESAIAFIKGRNTGSGATLFGEAFRYPVLSKRDGLTIAIENESPLPSGFVGIQYRSEYSPRASLAG